MSEIISNEYTARKGDVNLYMFRKRLSGTTELIRKETGIEQYAFFGQSSGALRAAAFANACPNNAKQFITLSAQARSTQLGINRHRFWHVLNAFLTIPPRRDSMVEYG